MGGPRSDSEGGLPLTVRAGTAEGSRRAPEGRGMKTRQRKPAAPGEPGEPGASGSENSDYSNITEFVHSKRKRSSADLGNLVAPRGQAVLPRVSLVSTAPTDAKSSLSESDKSVDGGPEEHEGGYFIVSRWGKVWHKAGCPCKPCLSRRRKKLGRAGKAGGDADESEKDTSASHPGRSPRARSAGRPAAAHTSTKRAHLRRSSSKKQDFSLLLSPRASRDRHARSLAPKTREDVERAGKEFAARCAAAHRGTRWPGPGGIITARALLQSGLLTGRAVECRNDIGKILLSGVVTEQGLISCAQCGSKAVEYTEFERHAGLAKSLHGERVYLSNGTTLKDFVYAFNAGFVRDFKRRDLSSLLGSNIHHDREPELRQSILARATALYVESAEDANPLFAVARGHGGGSPPPSPHSQHPRRSSDHRRLFSEGDSSLVNGERVVLKPPPGKRAVLGGTIEKPGIRCDCCDEVLSCSQFESHAGCGGRRAPYDNIFVSSGKSLAEVAELTQGEACAQAKGSKVTYVGSQTCFCCGGEGKLVTCDACPQAFHLQCAGLDEVPTEPMYCPYCATLPTCRMNAQTLEQCSSLLSELDCNAGGCVLCSSSDFSRGGFSARTVILCDQCEREFHVGCLKTFGVCDLSSIPTGVWFCSQPCLDIHGDLRGMCFQEKALDGGYSYELLRGAGPTQRTRQSLGHVLEILRKSFDPLTDVLTGVDLLPKMVSAESYNEHDFSNVHALLLRHEGKPVCAAAVRICGQFLAELPFIATKEGHRKRGHCKQMMRVLQYLLATLRVKRLCLPAAQAAMGTWTKGFGFGVMNDADFRQARARFRILIFPGTVVLVKNLRRNKVLQAGLC